MRTRRHLPRMTDFTTMGASVSGDVPLGDPSFPAADATGTFIAATILWGCDRDAQGPHDESRRRKPCSEIRWICCISRKRLRLRNVHYRVVRLHPVRAADPFTRIVAPRLGRGGMPSTRGNSRTPRQSKATPRPPRPSPATRFAWARAGSRELNSEERRPNRIPVAPPRAHSKRDSTRNCCKMSRERAPIGHPQADLPRSLGNGDQHDVHDSDAADHQRDHRHDQEQ